MRLELEAELPSRAPKPELGREDQEDPVLAQCAGLGQLDDGEEHAGLVGAEGICPAIDPTALEAEKVRLETDHAKSACQRHESSSTWR
jgi:hypothetical protein